MGSTFSQKKIILISSGQPSLNPRLVKEADSLALKGYDVTVLYVYWNEWGTKQDKSLLNEKKWKAIRLAGDPSEKPIIYFFSRLIFKFAALLLQKTNSYNLLGDISIARSSLFLINGAKKFKADLYIAHNLGALPAAAITAKKHKMPFGFDAEDFHRQEVSDDLDSFHAKISKYIEDKYIPNSSYLTASSALIADKYEMLYNKKVTTILNVFPKATITFVKNNKNEPIKLFWFSQTIGPNRGLEIIIEAIGITKNEFEFHILGNVSPNYKDTLLSICDLNGVNKNSLKFYEPVNPNQIFSIASNFDIGLASETGFSLNNIMAVSNKIFTYIQSGLALVVSNTAGQSSFINAYNELGFVYNNSTELAQILDNFSFQRDLLFKYKNNSYNMGRSELNWEIESKKFIEVIDEVFNHNL